MNEQPARPAPPIRADGRVGRAVLMISHCAGMVDMVALPVWVGTLIAGYRFDPQQAGALVTCFLLGAVVASVVLAPRWPRLSGRLVASAGFAVAALAFWLAASRGDGLTLALLHAIGGCAAGTALSVTHGTIGRSANPHRLFGLAGSALGVFSVLFLGGTPQLIAAWGAPALFRVFAGVMAVACIAAVAAFPRTAAASTSPRAARHAGAPLPRAVWFGMAGVGGLALVQAMMFSFVERIGVDRGFGVDRVTAVLIAIGLVTIFPAGLAALWQRHLQASRVVLAGTALQALLALVISRSDGFAPYAASAALLVAVMLFTHTFAFGQLARLDPSGRAVSATPAMLMIGSAIGPVLGGTIVKAGGYAGLGIAALVIDGLAFTMFLQMNRHAAPRPVAPLPA